MRVTIARKPLREKLAGETGETIVETLVSVLISSLALLMLATAIGTSVNIVMRSRDHMQEFYKEESDMVNSSKSPTSNTKDYASQVEIRQKHGQVNVYSTEDESVYLYTVKEWE